MRLLWVVPRYGADVVGGAETLVRGLATRATPEGWSVEVATTCAIDHTTWRNVLPAGWVEEDGIRVHRFPVGQRDHARYELLHAAVQSGSAAYVDELEWLAHGAWSPELDDFIERSPHDLVVLCPYLFGTTVWGAHAAGERAVMMPCLHDEPYARVDAVRRTMQAARGCMFNAPAEERLARRLYRLGEGGVVGMGYDPPPGRPPAGFARRHGLGTYLIYAGRIEEGKRVGVAVEYAVRYARERAGAPRLLLIGRGTYRPPRSARGAVVELGFLSDAHKRAAFAEALALVNPSHLESLSLVLLESWLEGTPALVATGSEVMREHVETSGGGRCFASYAEYRDAVDELLADPAAARRMGAAGREYVLDVYGWPEVARRFRDVLERIAA